MPIMVRPRKIVTEGALGSRSGDQLVSQFYRARINLGALYCIKKKSGSLKSIDRALSPLDNLRQYLFRERKPYPRLQSRSAPILARAFWRIHSNHLLPTPPQPRDFSSCCVKQGGFSSSASVYGDLQDFPQQTVIPTRRSILEKKIGSVIRLYRPRWDGEVARDANPAFASKQSDWCAELCTETMHADY